MGLGNPKGTSLPTCLPCCLCIPDRILPQFPCLTLQLTMDLRTLPWTSSTPRGPGPCLHCAGLLTGTPRPADVLPSANWVLWRQTTIPNRTAVAPDLHSFLTSAPTGAPPSHPGHALIVFFLRSLLAGVAGPPFSPCCSLILTDDPVMFKMM